MCHISLKFQGKITFKTLKINARMMRAAEQVSKQVFMIETTIKIFVYSANSDVRK